MILKAKHNFIIYPFFKWYAGFIINRHFGTLRIVGELKEKNLPVLLISNHISWWDGFWAMYVNLNVLHRKYHFMMLEEQLRKYRFFNYTGGYSVSKKSKSIIETLNYTSELLNDSNNIVLVFPQGEIQSLHNQNIQFENGLERILRNKENAVQVVFLVNLIDYFSNRKPGIYFHIQEYVESAFDMKSIQDSYNLFYAQSVEKQKNFNK
jgi:1-acyl-sn-glycerol-3-phosphate acyltransferase